MKTYLVGGAVRDKLLGLPVRDRDYVVVGATPEEMTAKGFKPVGADFPVFLHPVTKEEYALARTERKSGRGYKGFTVHAAPDVTLEDDLRRRDLTINAMAEDEDGVLIDPFGGARDLEAGILRHVSPAFAEDPVRILRVARLAARYAGRGFRIAPETNRLMHAMVESGEVDSLVPERVWAELERALTEERPARFFEVLRDCGALARLFPEINALFGVPQPEQHHPENDTGAHTMLVLDTAARLSPDARVRFAALMHDLGKGTTPKEEWPQHIGHEERGGELVRDFCRRFRVPNEYRDLAVLAARYHAHAHRALELRPGTLLELFGSLDAFRKPERLELFLRACEADARGRAGREHEPYPQADLLRRAFAAARAVDTAAIAAGAQGADIGAKIRDQRIRAIKQVVSLE
ncbi:MAG: multifunctional CCA tRNA nucleotidyl transferase/2'3'-cyclic phosphodiesterase/2'nucleotidase/phosphatase [Candidatus Muproteobacteria bacterium RIFCSPHIGHO2_01_FULL_65_16]|uniref:Multifunctional CCA protein n=1 Tax=Candidatus Muproteobacteria bacterium RIFCSPHIGHO2_01_FULL_65_16 TaxID=1817764 RepID=A0A1F6TRI7_9PROT|nr:MAG: multifunctional CCA tRNA nucleotidyl transferase/2'3'-cyclic phosphodiesterase/2'nucleotidase/phosphatase [Candidatus Muproteobacteria bacterium RIFCSPHIGHO2_01_FULL_65_16]